MISTTIFQNITEKLEKITYFQHICFPYFGKNKKFVTKSQQITIKHKQ